MPTTVSGFSAVAQHVPHLIHNQPQPGIVTLVEPAHATSTPKKYPLYPEIMPQNVAQPVSKPVNVDNSQAVEKVIQNIAHTHTMNEATNKVHNSQPAEKATQNGTLSSNDKDINVEVNEPLMEVNKQAKKDDVTKPLMEVNKSPKKGDVTSDAPRQNDDNQRGALKDDSWLQRIQEANKMENQASVNVAQPASVEKPVVLEEQQPNDPAIDPVMQQYMQMVMKNRMKHQDQVRNFYFGN